MSGLADQNVGRGYNQDRLMSPQHPSTPTVMPSMGSDLRVRTPFLERFLPRNFKRTDFMYLFSDTRNALFEPAESFLKCGNMNDMLHLITSHLAHLS